MKKAVPILLCDDSLDIGGKERLMLSALRGIRRNNYEVHLCLLRSLGELGSEAVRSSDGFLCAGRRSRLSFVACRRIRKYILDNEIRIVHCNGVIDALHAYIATIGLSVKLIYTLHGFENGLHKMVSKHLAGKAHRIISVSDSFMKELVKQGYDRTRIFVVPNCAADAFYTVPEKKTEETLRLVSVSRFDWSKDQLSVVEAVGLLRDEGADVQLDLIGTGEECYLKPVRDLILSCGLDDRVHFLGLVDDVATHLRSAGAFILSSRAESFGIAVVEAMASGLPVLVSDIPPFREITDNGKCAVMFKPGDPVDIAESIRSIYYDRQMASHLGELAAKRSLLYTEDAFCRNLERVYSDLLGNSVTKETDPVEVSEV